MTKITYIPGEIANAAIDEHGNRKPVTRTQHVFDDAKGKSQAEINEGFGNAIGGLNSQNYVTVDSFNALPATGEADTVYRVSNWDGTQQDQAVYSEYAWNGNQYVHLSTKTQIGEVFDVSAYHATGSTLATYADLSAALGTNGANIPQSLRKGGMSIKFIQSSDNKYVQARCMAQNFTTDTTQWQGVDDEPTAGSKNLAESGSIYKCNPMYYLSRYNAIPERNGLVTPDGTIWAPESSNRGKYKVIPVSSNDRVKISVTGSHYYFRIAIASAFDFENNTITLCSSESLYDDSIELNTPSGAAFIIINVASTDGVYFDITDFTINSINILYLTKVNTKNDECLVNFADKNNIDVLNNEALKYVNQNLYGFAGIKDSIGHLDTSFIIKSAYQDARYKVIKIENNEGNSTVKIVGTNCRSVLLSDYTYNFDDTQNYILATGETGRRSGSYEIVTDAKYILVQTINYQGTDITPKEIILNDINILSIVDVNKATNSILSAKYNNRLVTYDNDEFNAIPIELVEGDIDRISIKNGHLDPESIDTEHYPLAKYILVPVAGNRTMTLTAGIPRFVILANDNLLTTNVYTPAYGETGRRSTNVDSLVLPYNARFVAIQMINYEGRDCELSELIVGGVDYFHYNEKFKSLTSYINNSRVASSYPTKIYGIPKVNGSGNFDIDAIDSFFSTEIDDTINKVLEIMTEPCLCFPLITDIHYMAKYSGSESIFPQNLRNSTKIMRHLASILPIDFVLNLGDNIDATNYSIQERKQQCLETHQLFNEIGVNYLFAVGNHDLPVGVSDLFKYNIFSVRDAIFDTNSGFTNYYIDTNVNIRVIVVNAYCQSDYSSWLSSVLDSNKVNILCIHLSPLSNQNWDNNTFTYASNITTVLTSFVNNGGTLIQFFGHTHADFYFDSPWLSISTGCAQFVQPNVESEAYRKITDYEGSIVAPARTYTDATQQLFDIVVVRPDARKVNMIRFGAGSDREFTF